MIKLTVVGSGGSVPSKERNLPCVAMKYNRVYLFDIGEGTQRMLMQQGIPYGSIEAIFISHLHLDHYLGLYGLLETLALSNRKEKLYVFSPKGLRFLSRHDFVQHIAMESEGEIYTHRDFTVSAFMVSHGCSSFGFCVRFKDKLKFNLNKLEKLNLKGRLIRRLIDQKTLELNGKTIKLEDVSTVKPGIKIVYSGDTKYSENLIAHSEKADVIFHDCTFLEKDKKLAEERGHSTIEDCIKVLEKTAAKKLVLVHLNNRYTKRELFEVYSVYKKRYGDRIVLPEDGETITLKY